MSELFASQTLWNRMRGSETADLAFANIRIWMGFQRVFPRTMSWPFVTACPLFWMIHIFRIYCNTSLECRPMRRCDTRTQERQRQKI